ncbi:MAG: phosphoribosylformylglycinamidine synthase, partial [Chitinispirillia bacterium]
KLVYKDAEKPICLMDIAVIGMKELKRRGLLDDLEESDEINACSIVVTASLDNGKSQDWLVMFKNETHNHPTEIEPFGGAATCLGGAIRDPLSGRSYVYQAMRITGCGNPFKSLKETLPGKLPQRKISLESAEGYSSYGNQIGLATGIVTELYNEGYVAKRMEIGAVVAAAPKKNVIREKPSSGDIILLVGGRTGRDGCGGATGSSKAHTEDSISTCGAEVQKGNPPTERKIQRLFRNPEVSTIIKKCNDFGAGGVSVAIGELADGLHIDLDAVPKKYEGLDGTELAISESQERMAVLVDKNNADRFIKYAEEENLEATKVATVTNDRRIRILWQNKLIVDIDRDFINTNGVDQHIEVEVEAPDENENFFLKTIPHKQKIRSDLKEAWFFNLRDLNVCSQQGLVERFDSTIGAASVLHPFGGKYQNSPAESMVAKLPVLNGDTSTGTVISYGYTPDLALWSPFHSAVYAVVEAVSKIVASGGAHRSVRLTLQEYFEKLKKEPKRWGKPFASLLGALHAQMNFEIPAIGGKDSMSGTFEDISVPPTLVAIAVCPTNITAVISPEFKKVDSAIVYIPLKQKSDYLPDFHVLNKQYDRITELIKSKKIISAHSVKTGGIAAAVSKMAFGNAIGMKFYNNIDIIELFKPAIGSLVCEVEKNNDASDLFSDIDHVLLGETIKEAEIIFNYVSIPLSKAVSAWKEPMETLYPTEVSQESTDIAIAPYLKRRYGKSKNTNIRPQVLIPIFPGTNCEYDTVKEFIKTGAKVDSFVFINLTPQKIDESLKELVKRIDKSQIIMLPGGFSAGDEPDGSGKFIAAIFRNNWIKDAVNRLIQERDGLILGICNGFQALIKLGLVPFGEIKDSSEQFPTLTFNTIGRHVSRMITTRITSVLSPWFSNVNIGDIHSIPVSHGEGRFIASDSLLDTLIEQGQIATQYVDDNGDPAMDSKYNPNGSLYAIEGITSPDGRILGKMAHSERIGKNVGINISGNKDQKLFEAGVNYFR